MIGLAMALAVGTAAATVVTVVSANSPIMSLSRSEAADIFLGKSYRFPDGEQATPIDQPEASRAREQFYQSVAGESLAQLKAYWSRIIFTGRGQPPKIAASGAELKKLLAANPLAIGYLDSAEVDPSVKVLNTP